MKIYLEAILLILSTMFVLDCMFTGVIRSVLSPVNEVVINSLAVVLLFNSAFKVIYEVAA